MHRTQELKFLVFNYNSAASTTWNLSGGAFDIAQGTTDVTRIGDQITWAGHVDLKLRILNSTGVGADDYNTTRVILFQWHPNSTPADTDILLVGPSGVTDVYSQYNHDRRTEYCIVFDRTYVTAGPGLAATAPFGAGSLTQVHTYKIPLKGIHGSYFQKKVQYVGAGITGTNRFYLMFASDSAVAPHPVFTGSSKVVFRDG